MHLANSDHETALSAVRNLNNVDVGGRPLRIDLADSDPFLEGKTTVRGELVDGGVPGPAEPRHRSGNARIHEGDFMSHLPPGVHLPKGTTALDFITNTLAKMPPAQLMEVLAQMKAFIITHQEQARQLLVKHPQFAYALFQALVLNNIVDPAILHRMLEQTGVQPPGGSSGTPPRVPPVPPQHLSQSAFAPPPAHVPFQPPPPMAAMPPPSSLPPASAMFPPTTPSYYRPPPTTGASAASLQTAPSPSAPQLSTSVGTPAISESQRAMLMQVLALTQDQINGLPENERMAIMQLRSQFGSLGV